MILTFGKELKLFFKKKQRDLIEEAFEEHEIGALRQIQQLGQALSPYLVGARRKNQLPRLRAMPSIATVISASVHHTADTNEPTITLTTVDGKRYTLWLDRRNNVRSITDY